jgi:hypothetical protein
MTRFNIGSGGLARAVFLLLSGVAMSACGGDSTTGPPGGGTKEQWVTAASRSWSVPEATESYKCHSDLATSDKYYTGFRLASPPAAQAELYLLVRPSSPQVGDFDCDIGTILGGELIYAAGPGTTPVTFAGGKGVHVAAGQYTVLVEHLNNTSASPVTATTTIEGRVAAAKDVTTPIDMFFAGRLQFAIPADSDPHTANGGCGTAADMHLMAEIPIMRSLGVHQTFSVTDPQHVTSAIFDSSFDPQHVLFTSLGTDLLVAGGSEITASCTYVNTTGVVVNFGDSAHNEWCLLGLYRYPPKPPTSSSPVECAMGEDI